MYPIAELRESVKENRRRALQGPPQNPGGCEVTALNPNNQDLSEARRRIQVQKRASEPGVLISLPESAPHTIVRFRRSTYIDLAAAEQ